MSTSTLEEDEKKEKAASHLINGTGTPAEEREEEREDES